MRQGTRPLVRLCIGMLVKSDACAPVTLAEKVAFLSDAAYPGRAVTRRETHMSWVFFVDDSVYKLKKPVRLPYLDFSTLAQREAACRAEFDLNQALAPGVYLGVVPLVRAASGDLRLGGDGEIVDWLVRMRRLDEGRTLESKLRLHMVERRELDALADKLARFYRRTPRARMPAGRSLANWRAAWLLNRPSRLSGVGPIVRPGRPGCVDRRQVAVRGEINVSSDDAPDRRSKRFGGPRDVNRGRDASFSPAS